MAAVELARDRGHAEVENEEDPIRLASQCSVCSHAERDAIDEQLVSGRAVRKVATAFGLSKDGVHRHKRNHLDPKLAVVVAERVESGRMESLVDQLRAHRDAVEAILDSAMEDGRGALALAAVQQARAQIEAIDRMIEREKQRAIEVKSRGRGGPVELHVVYDDPVMTDEEAGVLARVLARFGLDGSDPHAIAKLDIATRRLEGAIEHPALPEPTTAHHGDGDERTDSDAAGNEPEP